MIELPMISIDFNSYSTRPDKCVLACEAAKLILKAKDIVYNYTGQTISVDADEELAVRRICQMFGLLNYKIIYDDYYQYVSVVTILNTTNFILGEKNYV